MSSSTPGAQTPFSPSPYEPLRYKSPSCRTSVLLPIPGPPTIATRIHEMLSRAAPVGPALPAAASAHTPTRAIVPGVKILVVDVGGTNVKVLASGRRVPVKIPSGAD